MTGRRSALVTGASRGIGRGIALSLAGQGFDLTITSRTEADLSAFRHELVAVGAGCVVHRAADMSDRDSLRELVEFHGSVHGGAMNVLILNAGVGTAGNVADFPVKRADKTIEVNLVSAFLLMQSSIPMLRLAAESDRARGATVVGISSITGAYAEAGLAVYGATKAALMSLLETVQIEEAAHGITATAIAPGYVDTDMSAWVTDRIPAADMISVDDVVSVVAMVVGLGRNAAIPKIVMTRRGSTGYEA